MIELYVREDLKMKKGKYSAQVAHAFTSSFFNMLEERESILVLSVNLTTYMFEVLEGLRMGYEYIPITKVENENALLSVFEENEERSTLITDQGRTTFSGQPTNTCVSISKTILNKKIVNCLKNQDQDFKYKQVFVINKNMKCNTDDVARHVAQTSLSAIIKGGKIIDGEFTIEKDSNLFKWMNEGFAKIVLKANANEIKSLIVEIKDKGGIPYGVSIEGRNPACLSIGAGLIEDIDPITSTLKLA
jgi:peptidyl-tRNA hydrolase